MLDWCPVCENLIPPERYTIQLPSAPQPVPQPANAPAQDKAPTGGPAKTTAKAGARRPGVTRQNSRGAAKKGRFQQMTKVDNKPAEAATTTTTSAPEAPTPAPPTRQRTIISQDPTPLYCSEKCRLEDEARNNLRPLEYGEVDWNMGGVVPPFATGYERTPLPMAYTGTSPSPHPILNTRSSTSASSSTLNTTFTASSDSVHSGGSQTQHQPPAFDPRRQRPEFLQMTSMPPPLSPHSSSSGEEMSSSAPATTDITSHPSHAILSDLGHPIPQNLPLERWNTVRNDLTEPDAAPLPRQTSAADLWFTGYTLAIQPGRSRMNSRHPSRMPTPTLTHWEDTTPTQSVLIPASYSRQDDSLEMAMASRRSDSGSSSRSAASSNRRRRSRSKRRHGSECLSDQGAADTRSIASHSRSSRGSVHGPSSHKHHSLATSFEDSRRHFRSSRQTSHPLSSSFSARDAEEELRKMHQDARGGNHDDKNGSVSQSVPNDRPTAWSRGPSFTANGKELPRVVESTTASGNASPEIAKKALAPISTSSSCATIAALPASISTRTVAPASPPKTAADSIKSSALGSSKRNSSLANLANAAASLFGLGGLGGLTMTAASTVEDKDVSKKSGPPAMPATPEKDKEEKEPVRGRSRASSRAQPSHQLLNGSASLASSSSLVEMSKTMASGGSRLPISMSTADMQVAKRPLGPIPKERLIKTRSSTTQARDEGPKQPLTVDVSGKRKSKEKGKEEGPMTSPPPTSSTHRSKESPHSVAPPKSAWDPDLVRDLKESRRLSREASYHTSHPNMLAYGGAAQPVNPFLPSSPVSPTSPYTQHHRRRTTSHSQSKSHSRSHSTTTVAEEEGGDKDAPLPRVKSNQSITSMTTSSSSRRGGGANGAAQRHSSSKEPPSPSATLYSIAGPAAPRIPRGMSMTSLSGQGFGVQPRGSMYGGPVSPGVVTPGGQGNGVMLPRTASQPYMHRWTSGSPSAGGSAFGSPNAPTPTGYYGHYASHHHHGGGGGGGGLYGPIQPLQPLQPLPPSLNRAKSREAPKATGPVYPVLALPEKRKVVVKKKVVDEQGQEVEVEQEEEEDVYTKPKRLFYFDR